MMARKPKSASIRSIWILQQTSMLCKSYKKRKAKNKNSNRI